MSDDDCPSVRPLPPLSPEERRLSLSRILGEAPGIGAVRVFAYGSLIWDPCFAYEELETAVLDGYRRAFNFWSVMSRGTPEKPGLGLGLERGGSCQGIAYRLSGPSLKTDLEAIWQREMHSAVYEPHWLRVRTSAGLRHAIGFVTGTAHGQYAGGLSVEITARVIAGACGEKGPCRDYLAATVTALAEHGIDDPALSDLLRLVDRNRQA